MVRKIKWSKKALAELGQIIMYLNSDVSEAAATKFATAVKTKIDRLSANTLEGRLVPTKPFIRFVLIGKTHRMYYRSQRSIIHITRFYDTRQDPEKVLIKLSTSPLGLRISNAKKVTVGVSL
jgi:plasmid stabilization system protein ParE